MEVTNVRKYKVGYEIRTEYYEPGDMPGGGDSGITMKTAYTPEGYYIGSSKRAYRLVRKRGIKPEKINPDHKVCSIGFSESQQKWFGWSHRAISGFGIGDSVSNENHLCAHSGWIDEYLTEHPEEDLSLPVGFVAKTLDDARQMAVAFADSVA